MSDENVAEWTNRIVQGGARETLLGMPPESVHCVVTSPPYYGLRDYGDAVDAVWGGDDDCEHDWSARETPVNGGRNSDENPPNVGSNAHMQDTDLRGEEPVQSDYCHCGAWRGQFGLEPTLDQYVRNVVEVADAVGHVLREDGVFFLNLGDSYASKPRGNKNPGESTGLNNNEASFDAHDAGQGTTTEFDAKQKMLVPHRVAIALQEAGWWVRQDVVWAKPNPIPHPVKDRRREDKEFVFHLTKRPHYWYDLDAIRKPHKQSSLDRNEYGFESAGIGSTHAPREDRKEDVLMDAEDACHPRGKNPGDILEVPTRPYADAHYATFPPDFVRPFVKVGSPPTVCASCGTPYDRETETEYVNPGARTTNGPKYIGRGEESPNLEHRREARHYVGEWQQQCECDTDETLPGVVLDPFCGTGTTCSVADELGRRWVGIDLDPDSVALAQRDVGVTVDEPDRLPEREDGQTGLEAVADGGDGRGE